MNLYLAGTAPYGQIVSKENIPYVLESFFYFKEWQKNYIKGTKDFLLDSGAFTFMQNAKNVDWNEYINRYAKFIVNNDIENFFELDIDSVVGYKEVLAYRKRLEKLTGRPCIPVWHKTRGIEEFKKMCENYHYVAIGGIVTKEIKRKEYEIFPSLIKEAHCCNCKIHGLGFTGVNLLKKYHFDSVDSTSWTSGGRFGTLYKFKSGELLVFQKPKGKRCIKEKADRHNLREWIKFQKYAERNL